MLSYICGVYMRAAAAFTSLTCGAAATGFKLSLLFETGPQVGKVGVSLQDTGQGYSSSDAKFM